MYGFTTTSTDKFCSRYMNLHIIRVIRKSDPNLNSRSPKVLWCTRGRSVQEDTTRQEIGRKLIKPKSLMLLRNVDIIQERSYKTPSDIKSRRRGFLPLVSGRNSFPTVLFVLDLGLQNRDSQGERKVLVNGNEKPLERKGSIYRSKWTVLQTIHLRRYLSRPLSLADSPSCGPPTSRKSR